VTAVLLQLVTTFLISEKRPFREQTGSFLKLFGSLEDQFWSLKSIFGSFVDKFGS